MLAAGLCRVTGFEPQERALAVLQKMNGGNERYPLYAVGDGKLHTLNICRASGMTSLLEADIVYARNFSCPPVRDASGEAGSVVSGRTAALFE